MSCANVSALTPPRLLTPVWCSERRPQAHTAVDLLSSRTLGAPGSNRGQPASADVGRSRWVCGISGEAAVHTCRAATWGQGGPALCVTPCRCSSQLLTTSCRNTWQHETHLMEHPWQSRHPPMGGPLSPPTLVFPAYGGLCLSRAFGNHKQCSVLVGSAAMPWMMATLASKSAAVALPQSAQAQGPESQPAAAALTSYLTATREKMTGTAWPGHMAANSRAARLHLTRQWCPCHTASDVHVELNECWKSGIPGTHRSHQTQPAPCKPTPAAPLRTPVASQNLEGLIIKALPDSATAWRRCGR